MWHDGTFQPLDEHKHLVKTFLEGNLVGSIKNENIQTLDLAVSFLGI